NSPEFQTGLVQQAYQRFLHRAAEPGGLAFWLQFLQQGNTVEQMEAGITGSAEYFQNRGGGTNAGFLTALYQDVLNRAVDPTGTNTFTQALGGGTTRGQVAATIFSGQEGLQNAVQGFYGSLLRRAADNAGLNVFVNAMQQGATDQQVIA